MLVKTPHTTYVVKFFHINPDFDNLENVRPGTTCLVADLNDAENNSTGDAFLNTKTVKDDKGNKHFTDHFVKSAGRKLSLKRAIDHFPREVRKLFWAEYWKQHAK